MQLAEKCGIVVEPRDLFPFGLGFQTGLLRDESDILEAGLKDDGRCLRILLEVELSVEVDVV